ncbi:MAG TPA: triose-phosphate isomerase [Gammaproteobacteria bacterium]|nr:triose-phosphate isomerase [Gammaproteobacteria bacterium]
MRRALVAGNWKLNGSLATIEKLIDDILAGIQQVPHAEVAVCPPYVYLPAVQRKLKGSTIALGAQDVSDHDSGAFTGEVSAAMLREFDVRLCIVGHSERRHVYGESDELTARKFAAARRGGLTPILCVGELLQEREQGATEQVVARQLDAVIELEGAAAFADAVIAYEPVWAIGTGQTATPEQAQAVHAYIRKLLAAHDAVIASQVRILYGGSVKADNAAKLFSQMDIDGGLIGGASLKGDEFLTICGAV